MASETAQPITPGLPETSSTDRAGSQRGFWSLFATQFQGAFSDNVFKFVVTFLILGAYGLSSEQRDRLAPVVGAIFALPFILFSMTGGFLADRFSKRTVAIGVKGAEIGIMSLGLLGFWLNNLPILILVVFLMSTQSAFFGPTKYGLLPELLPEKRLSWGNGVLGLGTFVAIISGTVLAGVLSDWLKEDQRWSGAILIVLACLGTATSLGITRLPPADEKKKPRINFLPELLAQFRGIRRDRVLFLAVLGSTYFWFLGALLQLAILFYGKDVLGLDDKHSGFLQASLAIGIGLGSFLAGYLSGRKIEYGLIPLGSMGLALFGALLSRAGLSFNDVALNLGMLGFFGGFYIVPINAMIQQRPDPRVKGSVIAVSAMLSFIGVFIASCVYYLFSVWLHLSPPRIFLAGAVMTFAGTIYAVRLMPDSLLRLLLWILTHTLYRLRVEGRDNIPERGGALFVCNHLSLADAVLLQASTDRPVRFIMFKGMYEHKLIKPFAGVMRAIPISSELRPREMLQSLKTASEAIKHGEVVCIFAEGQITRIGHLLPFRRGFEKIMKDVEAPIIPVCLDGVWGSIFSFEQGRFLWKLPRRVPFPVTVCYGKALPGSATPFEVRQAVQELNADAWQHRKRRMRTLDLAFVHSARRLPFRFAMADARTPRLSFGSTLMRTIFLARRLSKAWRGQKMVGVFLPPSIPGALVNLAALITGRVPVNLNYTVSQTTLESCVRQCELKTVVTSKAFLDQVKLDMPCGTALLEELAKNPGLGEKLTAFVMAWLLPDRMLVRLLREHRRRVELDDLATIIFSSGSTGDPKGVMLSHYNVISNIEQLGQTFALDRRDRVLGVLPFFHSFGFTGTLGLPAVIGVGVVYHPNPLDARTVGELVEKHAVTFVLATPTFLQLYMRSCSPEQFGSVQLLMVGAEKLPDRLAAAFEERFGIRPVEGYGCTECSPAVTVNTHDFRAAGFRQVGAKRGKIGHPLPGMCVRIVDPDTHQPLPPGQSGLLLVRGPNVMLGYLGRPEKTAEVLRESLSLSNTLSSSGRYLSGVGSTGCQPVPSGNLPDGTGTLRERQETVSLQSDAFPIPPGGLPGGAGKLPAPPMQDRHTGDKGRGEGATTHSSVKWYVTGDIAAMDEDGFLAITDRLSRFSKIGGEMVPHIKVEEKLHELAGLTDQTFAVTSMPDEKKGERLVVLHRMEADKLTPVLEALAQSDLPNLWKPKKDQFFHVKALPYLGTGKLDLKKIKELAATLSVG